MLSARAISSATAATYLLAAAADTPSQLSKVAGLRCALPAGTLNLWAGPYADPRRSRISC